MSGRLAMAFIWALGMCLVPARAHGADRWLLVDTKALTLSVMQGETPVTVFAGISIGQGGAARWKVRGDGRTPLGAYRITTVRDSERFHRFIELNYPSLGDAQYAWHTGLIDESTFDRIRTAHERGRQPPADTPLGGQIGIHGIGAGDQRIHEDFNWTDGCIALTNEEVDALAAVAKPGMTIVIH